MIPTRGDLEQLIAEAVDSQTKLEIVAHFLRNPYAAESLAGLARRLGRDPVQVDLAARELTAARFLKASHSENFGPRTVYTRNEEDPRRELWQALQAAYEGAEREEVQRRVQEADRLATARRLTADRRLHDLETRFLAMVSDQLRNPVNTIMGLVVSLLARPEQLTEEQAHTLGLIEQHAQTLIRLVEDLLLSATLSAGSQLPLNLGRCDLAALAREVESDFAQENGDYHWVLEVPSQPVLLEADRMQLRQVFGVLVRNAIKFSPKGTTITIAVGGDDQEVWGAVSDEGPGLGPADQERIFGLFYQAETDSTRLSGGLGLGLYLARMIVEAHGGSIAAEPREGTGLRVVFRLPTAGPPTGPGSTETNA